ncbi:serine/threonine protein kinase [Nocardioides glacieisoli]|uniref:non-specific serine/threonine protein kinase n=1 Tax=Nocardioides glacieisoli TaxID=1168730 RepID=A0A4Q2RPR1_9ACTN|nr:serine/threonine-protein kinase [Nocardioides glacieisoli]RYB89814.1 serine/threonine protein kinase [Nocardioides glacieisoli]
MVDTPRPGEPFGRYRIVRRIGHGGMGTVYEAVQENLGRSVALKVLLPQFSDEADFRARFAREAHALAALDSPHAIQVYDHGEESGQLFIATQLIHGPDLQRLVAERGPMPMSMALHVVAQVASGLADAHSVGILHRDIKPSNVLLREGHSEAHAYLCDFGIARAEDDDHTVTGGVTGTVGYMAPERHQGAPASAQTDIYALGCLLWVLLSGQSPYAGNTGVQMALAHMHEPVPQLGGSSSVLTAVNAILARAMDKRPDRRYSSAIEMRRDLLKATEAATAGGAAAADTVLRPPVEGTELRSPVQIASVPASTTPRRRRSGALLAAAAVAVVALLGGVGVALAGTGDDESDGDRASGTAGANASGSSLPAGADEEEASGSETAAVEPPPESEPSPSSTPKPRSRKSSTPTPEPSESVTSTPSPAIETAPATTVGCWNGAEASSRQACGLPSGPAGLATVFPSMAGCAATTSTVAGKVEVYECGYGDFLIRYTRWAPGFDRYGYLDSNNGVDAAEWYAQGEFAGRQWTNFEGGDPQPYQWSATYRYYPYSVSVEGTSEDARQRGVAAVAVTAPSRIGLR